MQSKVKELWSMEQVCRAQQLKLQGTQLALDESEREREKEKQRCETSEKEREAAVQLGKDLAERVEANAKFGAHLLLQLRVPMDKMQTGAEGPEIVPREIEAAAATAKAARIAPQTENTAIDFFMSKFNFGGSTTADLQVAAGASFGDTLGQRKRCVCVCVCVCVCACVFVCMRACVYICGVFMCAFACACSCACACACACAYTCACACAYTCACARACACACGKF